MDKKGHECMQERTTKSDIGKACCPPGAPGPESKGSVKLPEGTRK